MHRAVSAANERFRAREQRRGVRWRKLVLERVLEETTLERLQTPTIEVVANVCDVTVAVLVSRLQDAASPCDATGAAEATTATESGPPAEAAPVDQEGLVNLNPTGVTVQLPIAIAADLCDVTVDVLVNELSDGSAPCNASSNADALVTTEDGGPVAQEDSQRQRRQRRRPGADLDRRQRL